MDLSVVVPTLNGRDRLEACLDALTRHAPHAEVLVINGPSADGTTGMIKDRSDVDVLIETPHRNVSIARNAGIAAATGDVIGIVRYNRLIGAEWAETITNRLAGDVDAVTGPTRGAAQRKLPAAGQLNPENVAFRQSVLESLNGFDEALPVGSMHDLWDRFHTVGYTAVRTATMTVTSAYGTDGGTKRTVQEYASRYRSSAYRQVKNGTISIKRSIRHGGRTIAGGIKAVVLGERSPTEILAGGRESIRGLCAGGWAGIQARWRCTATHNNPHGLSETDDRHVQMYDWR